MSKTSSIKTRKRFYARHFNTALTVTNARFKHLH